MTLTTKAVCDLMEAIVDRAKEDYEQARKKHDVYAVRAIIKDIEGGVIGTALGDISPEDLIARWEREYNSKKKIKKSL